MDIFQAPDADLSDNQTSRPEKLERAIRFIVIGSMALMFFSTLYFAIVMEYVSDLSKHDYYFLSGTLITLLISVVGLFVRHIAGSITTILLNVLLCIGALSKGIESMNWEGYFILIMPFVILTIFLTKTGRQSFKKVK